jgi:hypothetical protein
MHYETCLYGFDDCDCALQPNEPEDTRAAAIDAAEYCGCGEPDLHDVIGAYDEFYDDDFECDCEECVPVDYVEPTYAERIREKYANGIPGVDPLSAILSDFDPVDRPAHYTEGREIEPIDAIEDWGLGFLDGQVLKYISRWDRKGDSVENLKKARFYLNRLIAREESA